MKKALVAFVIAAALLSPHAAFALRALEDSASPGKTISDWFADVSREFGKVGEGFRHVFLESNTDD